MAFASKPIEPIEDAQRILVKDVPEIFAMHRKKQHDPRLQFLELRAFGEDSVAEFVAVVEFIQGLSIATGRIVDDLQQENLAFVESDKDTATVVPHLGPPAEYGACVSSVRSVAAI